MKQLFLILVLLLSQLTLLSQQESDSLVKDSIIEEVELLNQNRVYEDRIKSVRIRAKGSKYSEPIISVRAGSKIMLEFDDLNDDYQEYHYQLIHCNRFWIPTPIFSS